MAAPTSFRSGLYFSAVGADALPAIVTETDTPSAGNREIGHLMIFHPNGTTSARWAVILSATDSPNTTLEHYFVE